MLLKTPLTVKGLRLPNRLVMPPMATSLTEDGFVNQRLLDYYDEKSAGGHIGLVITEHSYITLRGRAHAGQISIARDEDIPGLAKLTEVFHRNSTRVVAQISHAGMAASQADMGMVPLGPSAVPNKKGEVPEALTKAQICDIVGYFADSARRAKTAGFDGVEIHGAHGYLLQQFYSPLTNRRTDEYGPDSMENRLRIFREVIEAVRETVGTEYPMALRLGGCDYEAGGATIADAVEAAKLLQGWGVDLLDLSGGYWGFRRPNSDMGPGYFADMSTPVTAAVDIPVLVTGGVTQASQAEALLQAGAANLIGVGRAILADSQWAANAMREE